MTEYQINILIKKGKKINRNHSQKNLIMFTKIHKKSAEMDLGKQHYFPDSKSFTFS
ncbi:hypothetical protein J2X31_000754 [Flavobacterium arsenatis]|uniref:Uncharacterized protein n=1 Tax=Flavobacterium arsenatis TaxID=1484332 RepID=A0ABU1TLD2_9FLAO|nr:hypothetical protein [Flavobacterium arsenatis]